MFRQLTAVTLIALALTGCGRAADVTGISSEARVKAQTALVNKDAKAGVVVDGRVYPEGQAPDAFVLPEPGAPASGKGHVRTVVSTKGLGNLTKAVTFQIMKGDEAAFAQIWSKDEIKGVKVAAVAENLEPGEYDVVIAKVNPSGGIYSQKTMPIEVKAGETLDLNF